ncbi:MAG: LacI family DNA-binding transcriptional regulator [Planctomycetia bacterium]|nr:LacI family DNA-binding transcriptional regulator [Planctomycetia bacterium]
MPFHRKPKSTLKQIADELGVSMMTVSRALNGRDRVSKTTQSLVLAAAKRLQYRPNRLVHAIKSGRSGTVGVMISVADTYSAKIIHGIHDVLAEQRFLPILHFHGVGPQANRDDGELDYLHRLLDQRVDGIIFWPSDETVSPMYLREVWERGVPLVAVDRHLPRTNAEFSGTDDVVGGRLAAEYLLSLGHRRLAHIGGEHWVSTYAERRRGFEDAIRGAADVVYSAAECITNECGAIAQSMLAAQGRPTAIFLASDRMAPPVYAAAESLGLRVGRDVSVVGFADLPEMRGLRPQLTTFEQHPYQVGCEAARLLLDRIDGRVATEKPRSVRVTPDLVVRESCGPVPLCAD